MKEKRERDVLHIALAFRLTFWGSYSLPFHLRVRQEIDLFLCGRQDDRVDDMNHAILADDVVFTTLASSTLTFPPSR